MKYYFGGTWIIWDGETWMTSYMVKLMYTVRCIVVDKSVLNIIFTQLDILSSENRK